VAAEEQGCSPTLRRRDRGAREGYQLDRGNKTPASERHRGQNSFLVEVARKCATKVNKGWTSTCKYHLCLRRKPNQNLKCCELSLLPPVVKITEKHSKSELLVKSNPKSTSICCLLSALNFLLS